MDKVSVTEKIEAQHQNQVVPVRVKVRLKNRKQLILKKLMLFGLKPSLRMAALKMLSCKKNKYVLKELEEEAEGEYIISFYL